ncbi:MAG: phospholipase [Verrucomicrobiales bacterium]|nr:phospholipase [Verrucomicrobiales bacterium]
MRTYRKNKDFAVQAYAGTTGILLAMNVSNRRRKDLLGFALERRAGGAAGKYEFQWSSLHFPGKEHTNKKFNATPSDKAPFQKFRWGIYNVEPGNAYDFRVYPVYGTPDTPDLDDPLELNLSTHSASVGDHSVIFNRAVAASQAFERKFPEVEKLLKKHKKLPIEKWPAEAAAWLTRGVLDQILGIIEKATDKNWALDIAIYEYELQAIVQAVNEAHARGVTLRIIYEAAPGEKQTAQNEASLRKIPKAAKRARVPLAIFHDKFIVLSKVEGGKRKPQEVLCGSTNFTENGVYRQANVVHVIRREDAATQYAGMFEELWTTADDGAATRKWVDRNNPVEAGRGVNIGFSPRSGIPDLQLFEKLIKGAKRDILFSTAFDLYDTIDDALLGDPGDPILRYGLQNSRSRITGFHADRDADFVVKALLPKGLEGWQAESTKGQVGSLLVHTKVVIVDFTGKKPTVISGSHNLSRNASYSNDENYLIIRGDTDLADCYGCEVLRFYDHYRFRYYASHDKTKKPPMLEPNSSWTDPYFKNGTLKRLDRERFCAL